MLCY
ncbi:CPXV181 protein [Cowpox virus]|jgi:hypothetical protein